MLLYLHLFCMVILLSATITPIVAYNSCSTLTCEANDFLKRENELLLQRLRAEYLASYTYYTNVTEENLQAMIALSAENTALKNALANTIKSLSYDQIPDESIQQQLKQKSKHGWAVLSESDYKELQNALIAMQTNYGTAKICSYTDPSDCNLSLEPHIVERFAKSRDPKELEYYWRQWYDKTGTAMRENFAKYIKLSAKAAHKNNYSSNAEYWIESYKDPDFEKNLETVYKAILPIYRELHGYVRYRLREHYGAEIVPAEGNIPMHLLGDVWAQQWDDAIQLFTPFPEKSFIDVTAEMKKQQYTVHRMFELGDQFFKSLNMRALPQSFWNLSVFEKPTDREILCEASAWDLYGDSDVRIKMCAEVNAYYLYAVHHELGHIQYYLQYGQQQVPFRNAPNPGFQEAVGDVIALSVLTPKHLNSIGLSPVGELDEESRINELFLTALKKIVLLPFSYTMDKYRYAVFRGEVNESTWNSAFWQMRSEYSGVEPPIPRSDRDFDPPAKYHIDANTDFSRYFAAHIFQFQFHKALCIKADQYKPGDRKLTLDNCDIYNSTAAGAAFSKFLAAGGSRHWKDVLKELTGETEMDPSALLEYFEPLQKWLKAENRRLHIPLGWNITNDVAKD